MKNFLILLIGSLILTANSASGQAYYTTIYTPKNSVVQGIYFSSEPYTSAELAAYYQQTGTNYPNATRLTSATGRYNCHSYCWYSQSTSNTVWLNPYTSTNGTNLAKYMSDGSYTQRAAWLGDKVYYGSQADHSGTVYPPNQCGQIRSKWGRLPLMLHMYNYCPYPSNNLTFYKYFNMARQAGPGMPATVEAQEAVSGQIYPNPAQSVLNIQFQSSKNGFIALFSSTGQRIIRRLISGEQSVKININSLPSGFYTAVFETIGSTEVIGKVEIVQ